MARPSSKPKYGLQIKTQWNCKICQSPHRAAIEDVLYLRHAGELLPDGVRPTLAWITANSPKLWEISLNEDNVKSHSRRHFSFAPSTAGVVALRDSRDVEDIRADVESLAHVPVDDALQEIVDIGMATIRRQPERITPDHVMKAAAELTKRKVNDRDSLLMGALVDALSRPKENPNPQVEAQVVPEIEAEVVEEVTVDGEPG